MKFCHIYIILHVLYSTQYHEIFLLPAVRPSVLWCSCEISVCWTFEEISSSVSKAISMWFLQERFQMQTKCIEAHENMLQKESGWKEKTGILLPKLFWPTVRKNCSSDREKLWNSRLKTKNMQNFEITRTIYLLKQWNVRTIFGKNTAD